MAFDRSLKIANPSLEERERSYLTSRYSSGVTLTVASNQGFAANDIIVVGVPGEEKTESQVIASVSGDTTITLNAALNFTHALNTPIFRSKWDQIDVERRASGGSFTDLSSAPATSPVDIDWDNPLGFTYVDVSTVFAATDDYRWQFKNSANGNVSGYADVLPATGLPRDSVGYVIKMIKQNPVAKNVPGEVIVEYFNDLHDEEYENNPEAWYLQKQGTAIPTDEDVYEYELPSDFGRMKFLLYHYTSGDVEDTYPLNFISEGEMRVRKIDQNQTSDDKARDWTFFPPDSDSPTGHIVIDPTPETDDQELIPIYYQELSAVESYGDTLVIPKAKIYLDYALYRIYEDIEDDQTATKYEARVRRGLTGLKSRQHRNVGQREFLKWRGQLGAKAIFTQNKGTGQRDRENYW